MFDAAWHDEQIAFHKLHRAVAEFDLELALEHEEEVVGVRMAVPDELALGLYHLDLVVVDRRDDARREALIEERELLREIDRFVHETGHASAHTPGPCAIGAVRPSRAGQAPARKLAISSASWPGSSSGERLRAFSIHSRRAFGRSCASRSACAGLKKRSSRDQPIPQVGVHEQPAQENDRGTAAGLEVAEPAPGAGRARARRRARGRARWLSPSRL